MKYLCFGYYDKGKFDGMTESERNAMFDTCFEYAETKEQLGGILVLEARDMNHAVQLMSQHPALTYGNIFEIRPAGDMNEVIKASEQRRRKTTAR